MKAASRISPSQVKATTPRPIKNQRSTFAHTTNKSTNGQGTNGVGLLFTAAARRYRRRRTRNILVAGGSDTFFSLLPCRGGSPFFSLLPCGGGLGWGELCQIQACPV